MPKAATAWVDSDDEVEWKPICDDPNNRGHIEIVETDVQGLVELLTNSSDAYLIQNLDNVNSREELLNSLDDEEVLVEFTGDSSGRGDSEYSVVVADEGCGVERDEFENAFLRDPSLGGVDKRKYEYLYGEFGQGSLASIGVSKKGCKFVASASKENRCRIRFFVEVVDFCGVKYLGFRQGMFVFHHFSTRLPDFMSVTC